jgi:hypothetical protein
MDPGYLLAAAVFLPPEIILGFELAHGNFREVK